MWVLSLSMPFSRGQWCGQMLRRLSLKAGWDINNHTIVMVGIILVVMRIVRGSVVRRSAREVTKNATNSNFSVPLYATCGFAWSILPPTPSVRATYRYAQACFTGRREGRYVGWVEGNFDTTSLAPQRSQSFCHGGLSFFYWGPNSEAIALTPYCVIFQALWMFRSCGLDSAKSCSPPKRKVHFVGIAAGKLCHLETFVL